MTCELASTYVDLSQIRHIEDNQELFAEPETDSVFSVEVLEYTSHVPDSAIAEHCFVDISEGNEAKTSRVVHKTGLNNFFVASGVQTGIAKARENDSEGNDVIVWVAVRRLPAQNADVVVSLTTPTKLSSQSSSTFFDAVPLPERGQQVFMNVLESFQIVDLGLFAT